MERPANQVDPRKGSSVTSLRFELRLRSLGTMQDLQQVQPLQYRQSCSSGFHN